LQKNTKPYELVSIIYDELMKGVNYNLWGKYLMEIIKKNSSLLHPSVLEVGAGNGKLAALISKKYPDYIVSDFSQPMLKNSVSEELPGVCCNMISLPFKKKFDIILSTFDSVNYLLTSNKLLDLFREMKRLLSLTGIFLFDVSLEQNSIEFERSYENNFNHNEYQFIRKSKFYSGTRIHKNIFLITDKMGNKFHEIHKQKIYKFNTYFRLIEKAGLFVVDCFDAFTFRNGNENCGRVQFVVKTDKSKC